MSSRKTFSAAVYLLLLLFSYNSWLPIRKLVKKPENSGVVLKAYFIRVFSYAVQCVFVIVLLFYSARRYEHKQYAIIEMLPFLLDAIVFSDLSLSLPLAFLNLTGIFITLT